jgi:hypothetical protein
MATEHSVGQLFDLCIKNDVTLKDGGSEYRQTSNRSGTFEQVS